MERQRQPLLYQRDRFSNWLRKDLKFANKIIIADTFTEQVQDYINWEYTSFYPGWTGHELAVEARGDWVPANFHCSKHGLQIRSLILRSKEEMNLRALSCKIRCTVRLGGESTVWFMTRGSLSNDETAIVKIRKEQNSHRVFIIFGGPVGPNNEFRFFKKLEIPDTKDVMDDGYITDTTELKLTLVDFGDDKISVQVSSKNGFSTSNVCNRYIPVFHSFPLLVAGSGDSVVLKYIAVQTKHRTEAPEYRSRDHYECCRVF